MIKVNVTRITPMRRRLLMESGTAVGCHSTEANIFRRHNPSLRRHHTSVSEVWNASRDRGSSRQTVDPRRRRRRAVSTTRARARKFDSFSNLPPSGATHTHASPRSRSQRPLPTSASAAVLVESFCRPSRWSRRPFHSARPPVRLSFSPRGEAVPIWCDTRAPARTGWMDP